MATEWIVGSSAWVDRSLTSELVMPSISDDALDMPDLKSPAGLLPEKPLLLVSAAFDPDVDNWRESLQDQQTSDVWGDSPVDEMNLIAEAFEYEIDVKGLPRANRQSGLDFFIDLGIAVVDEVTGVDLEEDLFDYLEGDVSLAVWDLAFDGNADIGDLDIDHIDEGPPISLVTLLLYKGRSEDDLAGTIKEFQEFLEDEGGVSFESVDVGADRDAQIVDIDVDYSPSYVLNDGYLIFGSTKDSLAEIVELQGARARP